MTEARPPGNSGPHWARIAGRRIRLADGAQIVRQEHRGVLWYVVHDRIGDRFYRFSPAVYVFLSLLDGRRTVEEAYRLVLRRLGEDAPSELDLLKLFWRLHAADLLVIDGAAQVGEVVLRADALDRQRVIAQLRSPLAIRIPLMDPARLLAGLRLPARMLYSVPGFLLWLALVAYALGLVAMHWDELTHNLTDRLLAVDNLILMWFVFPVVKFLHEMGHGLALRRWDRTSHEMGIMFLVFMPVPYVDASASSTMRLPHQRAIIGAGGLYVELLIAALATILWTQVEPGLVRAVCFNVMTVAGVSAVLFNANPLLRYDAYYVATDLLELPNLGPRSSQYWMTLFQHHVLGMKDATFTREAAGEVPWLAIYAPLSTAYRLVLMFGIAVVVAKQFFFIGTVLAALAVFNIVIWPIGKGLAFLLTSARLRRGRARALTGTAVAMAVLAAVLFAMPMPNRTVAQGVIWYETGAELRPLASGTVLDFAARSGARVEAGTVLATLDDPETRAEIAGLEARLDALRAQNRREIAQDRDKARLTAEEITYIAERLAAAQQRLADLRLVSPAAGQLVIPRQRDLDGGWLGRGVPIGHVVGDDSPVVLVALRQADMELVRRQLDGVSVRIASDLRQPHQGRVARMVPLATDALPAELLSTQGGGPFSLRQNAPQESGLHSVETVFILEVAFQDRPASHFGERAFVRFDHGQATLARQLARSLRQLFLREFEV
ncbi:biotin/lipoyl-binding protein [Phaeovulum sp. NW3]|uniref:biotin/lipoyl-binding protein n=1 Tax=Phaeovulum sp. NW3 TaxID=2934933 RepID=UPI002021E513|nr:biotin/lipoyl-binding protein [Phaeovulum sp. NW3]MCL7466539.1 HlyD family secretion protein [Phaeovulum sp. NW3]